MSEEQACKIHDKIARETKAERRLDVIAELERSHQESGNDAAVRRIFASALQMLT